MRQAEVGRVVQLAEDPTIRHWKSTWIDEVSNTM